MGLQGGTLALAPVRGNGKTVFTSDNWRVGVLGSLGWLGWLGWAGLGWAVLGWLGWAGRGMVVCLVSWPYHKLISFWHCFSESSSFRVMRYTLSHEE